MDTCGFLRSDVWLGMPSCRGQSLEPTKQQCAMGSCFVGLHFSRSRRDRSGFHRRRRSELTFQQIRVILLQREQALGEEVLASYSNVYI